MTNNNCFISASEAKQKSKEIDKTLKKESSKPILKLLLLGSSDSGKSTLFKQMKIIQENGGYSNKELEENRGIIFENIISQMNILLDQMYNDRQNITSIGSSGSGGASDTRVEEIILDDQRLNLPTTSTASPTTPTIVEQREPIVIVNNNAQPVNPPQTTTITSTTTTSSSSNSLLYFQDPFNFERAARVKQAYQLVLAGETPTRSWSSIINDIKLLWESKEIQHQFNIRENGTKYFHFNDSAPYFLNNLHQYSNEKFIPTEQDILRIRTKTTSITEADYVFRGLKFRMVDVGGQKGYRSKWVHCFDSVSAVIFVASLSSYDQVLEEDSKTNRLEDSLALFKEFANSKHLQKSALVLFLNKFDLFRVKIKKIPLKRYFPNFTAPQSTQSATNYVTELFHSQLETKRQIYIHHTCAIDTSSITKVFQSVIDDLLKKSLDLF